MSYSYIRDGDISMSGKYKSIAFLEMLRELNVIIISEKVHSQVESFSNFIAVTLTGTIAIERSLRDQKTIIAGIPGYGLTLPGTFQLDSVDYQVLIQASSDHKIKTTTSQQLLLLLNNKLMANPLGIGSGNPAPFTQQDVEEFRTFFKTDHTFSTQYQ